jgi:hypothetical protein
MPLDQDSFQNGQVSGTAIVPLRALSETWQRASEHLCEYLNSVFCAWIGEVAAPGREWHFIGEMQHARLLIEHKTDSRDIKAMGQALKQNSTHLFAILQLALQRCRRLGETQPQGLILGTQAICFLRPLSCFFRLLLSLNLGGRCRTFRLRSGTFCLLGAGDKVCQLSGVVTIIQCKNS